MYPIIKAIPFLLAGILLNTTALATVAPHSLFSKHMVLQQGVAVPVWGTATSNEIVTLQLNGQTAATMATNGKWMVKLKPLASGGPYRMIISGTNTIVIDDVLVGEVWLCSGQSNMERQLGPRPPQKPIYNWQQERDAANYPLIRQYFVPHKFSPVALSDVQEKWEVCTPAAVKEWSAVGYFFARDLFEKIHVPLGILFSAYGGTEAEQWTSRATLDSNTELAKLVQAYDETVADFPNRLQQYEKQADTLYAKYLQDSTKATTAGKPLPRKSAPPANPAFGRQPGGLYNGMVAPLLPYAIKGVCWYQGENNVDRWQQYPLALSTLIADWRTAFGAEKLPFLIVQIAPYKTMLPELREAQLQVVQSVANTALIVTTDCGDSADIHPVHKQPVGERLALAARALAYHETIEYSGPVYQKMKVKGDKIVLQFTHVSKGLVAKDGPLIGFAIAGANQVFIPAVAVIKGKKIEVYSEALALPVAVRYGWDNVPIVNLYNTEGLPASPFRTGPNDNLKK